MEVLKGELKIKQMVNKWKKCLVLEWLIELEWVSYVGPQDDPCDLARSALRSSGQWVSAYISRNLTNMYHIYESCQQKACIF